MGVWTAGIIAKVTTGELSDDPARVEVGTFKDDAADVLKSRIVAAGGDLKFCHLSRGR